MLSILRWSCTGRKLLPRLHATLIQEFNEYLFEHPELAQRIPSGAIVVIQIANDPEYNAWSRALAEANRSG